MLNAKSLFLYAEQLMTSASPSAPWITFAKNWRKLTTPGRPSPDETRLFGEGMNKGLDASPGPHRILIHGSTPELRDLACSANAEVITLDINPDMTRAMTELMRAPNPRERNFYGNWLDAPFDDASFDAIIGDFTVGNLPFADHKKFYEETARLLKHTGRYVERIWCYEKDGKPLSLEELEGILAPMPVDFRALTLLLELGVFFIVPRFETREVRVQTFVDTVHSFVKAHPQSTIAKLWALDDTLFPHDKIWWMRERSDWNAVITPYFSIESEQYGDDLNMPKAFSRVFPVVTMAKS